MSADKSGGTIKYTFTKTHMTVRTPEGVVRTKSSSTVSVEVPASNNVNLHLSGGGAGRARPAIQSKPK
ncbi:hypothetical protein CRUP_023516 [Coryphaenoides rupestris]|nr:hypothetical protein CRUP_023516 [Coryphaenoides rupestris]